MFVKSYENLASSALNSLQIDKKTVYVVYNSNIDKEYEFDCQNTEEFTEMKAFIDDLRAKNKARKDAYKANPDSYKFISRHEIQQSRRRRLGLD